MSSSDIKDNTVAAAATAEKKQEEPEAKATYEAGCHCGYIKFKVTLSPPLPEYKVLNCNCSICRRNGYLLVYPETEDVTFQPGHRERCANYRFNTKSKDQMFCPQCGASLGIDFGDFYAPKWRGYGISVRSFDGVDLDGLQYEKFDGEGRVEPKGRDLSGCWWDEERGCMK